MKVQKFLKQSSLHVYLDLHGYSGVQSKGRDMGIYYSKTSILEYQKMYSKIGVYSKIEVIYEVFMNFGPQQKI